MTKESAGGRGVKVDSRGTSRCGCCPGIHQMLKAMGSDMDDFGLEFLNLIERSFGN